MLGMAYYPRDAGVIRFLLNERPRRAGNPLETAQVEAALQRLSQQGLVEQNPDTKNWKITSDGVDALYDWNPWRFLVERLIPAARTAVEEPDWLTAEDPDGLVAAGRLLGSGWPTFEFVHDAFEVENNGRRGWVIEFLSIDQDGRCAMTVDIDLAVGDILVRRSPPPGEPRPQGADLA